MPRRMVGTQVGNMQRYRNWALLRANLHLIGHFAALAAAASIKLKRASQKSNRYNEQKQFQRVLTPYRRASAIHRLELATVGLRPVEAFRSDLSQRLIGLRMANAADVFILLKFALPCCICDGVAAEGAKWTG